MDFRDAEVDGFMGYFAGVGSRETPLEVGKAMTMISSFLETEGYILRSGGAKGADTFFEDGIINPANKHIYLIEKGFKGHSSQLYGVCDEALAIAKSVHPKWDSPKMLYKNGQGQRLHGRNVYQILGKTLDTPSKFMVCWTEGGLLKGGTATAIKLAKKYNVPCLNLGSVTTGRYMDAFENFYLFAGAP